MADLLIESIAPDDPRWDQAAASHPDATFFHLGGWARVLERTFAYRSHSLVATKDGRVCGLLPLFLVRTLPFGRSLVSIPLAVYGGPCADDPQTARALIARAQAVADDMKVRYLELRNQTAVDGLPVKDLYVTFRKPIHSDPEKNMEAIPRKQRRMIRQGEKFGLTSTVGGAELLDKFYRIYAHSVSRLGSPVYPRTLFARLLKEFGPSCRILAVHHEGRMVAGVMTFFFRDQVIPYYGGALRDAFRYAANDFMYWQLMCHGAEHGYSVFDFGRSKEGTGPYDFKRHWGFEPTPLPYQYHLVRQKTMPDLSPKNPKFSLAIEAWKRMPLWLTRSLGPQLVRYFP